jgi:hypothetical protein
LLTGSFYLAILNFVTCLYLHAARENLKDAKKNYEKTEDDLKSLQSVGQIIGEQLWSLDIERCKWLPLLILTQFFV